MNDKLWESVANLRDALDERLSKYAAPNATPPTLAAFVKSGAADIVLSQTKGFEFHDLMHEQVVEEGVGAVMSQQCGCCQMPTAGRVYVRRAPQACIDLRIILAGDKACGKSTLLAHLLGAVSHQCTSLVLQQLRFHKASFANVWVNPTPEEINMMADELKAPPSAVHARALHLMATQLALGMLHIDTSELSYFLQDELPISGDDDAEPSSITKDRVVVEQSCDRMGLTGTSPPQDVVVRFLELGGDVIDELTNVQKDSSLRGHIREWLLGQLGGFATEMPLNISQNMGKPNQVPPAPSCLCYFINPKLSFVSVEAVKALVRRIAFLLGATTSAGSTATKKVHIFVGASDHSQLQRFETHLDELLLGQDAGKEWNLKLAQLIEKDMRCTKVDVIPQFADFFHSLDGTLDFSRPHMDKMLSALRMLLIENASILPRELTVAATIRAIQSVAESISSLIGNPSIPTKDVFAEALLNPHWLAKIQSPVVHNAPTPPPVPILPLTDITDMLTWLPPMLLIDCYDEAVAAMSA